MLTRDEVQTFRAGRYVSSNEAAWRILVCLCMRDTQQSLILRYICPMNGNVVYKEPCRRLARCEGRRYSWAHLHSALDGQELETFRQACEKLGLLEDDNHWDATMEEAVLCRSPSQIRELFALLITTCGLSNPLQLWDKYKTALSEDILHRFERMNQVNDDLCLNEALTLIEDKIITISGKKLSDFDAQVSETEPRLLPEQKKFMTKYHNELSLVKAAFFLDAPGGTAVASSGIAATLLSGGRTAHLGFKLPLNLASEETPMCNISKSSARGALLQQCKLIVWDECTMSHKRAIEALDRCLQDIQSNRKLMGGVVVLLAGILDRLYLLSREALQQTKLAHV
ncbi:hypothetical protein EVAR_33003_1 [Eumeta japonica]|uniref:ATP-dependent DNA helicase n=1 Tax=Eumeta variegata TaxID=151549 RepID=A0A4C1VQ84_EUMVA|nr:hypothetical protein EVAR_33003_1 [Eumeta japonica]